MQIYRGIDCDKLNFVIEVEEMEKARIRKRPRLVWDVAPSVPEVGFSYQTKKLGLGALGHSQSRMEKANLKG